MPGKRPLDLLRQRRKLPISGVQSELIRLARQHKCFVLVAETGSGKTTQVRSFRKLHVRPLTSEAIDLATNVSFALCRSPMRIEDCREYLATGRFLPQVPQFLVDSGLAQGGCIAVTQPRRVAAVSVAQRVAEERRCDVGGEVCTS